MSPRGIAAEAAFESRLDALDRAFGSNEPASGIDEAERSLQAMPPAAAPVEAIPDERFEPSIERVVPPPAPAPPSAPVVDAAPLVQPRAAARRALVADSFRALLAAEQAARVTAGGSPVVSGHAGLTVPASTAAWLQRTASSAALRFDVRVEPRAKGRPRPSKTDVKD